MRKTPVDHRTVHQHVSAAALTTRQRIADDGDEDSPEQPQRAGLHIARAVRSDVDRRRVEAPVAGRATVRVELNAGNVEGLFTRHALIHRDSARRRSRRANGRQTKKLFRQMRSLTGGRQPEFFAILASLPVAGEVELSINSTSRTLPSAKAPLSARSASKLPPGRGRCPAFFPDWNGGRRRAERQRPSVRSRCARE